MRKTWTAITPKSGLLRTRYNTKKPVPRARGRLVISFYSALKIAATTYCTWLNRSKGTAKELKNQIFNIQIIDFLHLYPYFE